MYNEETQEEILAHIESHNLSQGRFLYPIDESVIPNCLVETLEDGPVWHGDLNYAELAILSDVAKFIKKTLYCRSLTSPQTVQVSP